MKKTAQPGIKETPVKAGGPAASDPEAEKIRLLSK